MSGPRGFEVTLDRGVVVLRISATPTVEGAGPFSEDALASVRTLGVKGVKGLHGLVVDIGPAGAGDGAAHARLADAIAATLAHWERRGLPVAVVAPDRRAALEATRVLVSAAPRWGRVVATLADAERHLAPR